MTSNTATFFKKQKDFRNWLEKNHDQCTEFYVSYFKVKTRKTTISYQESVDLALCFGWIDGLKKSIDEERYMHRFTPRIKTSNWSEKNIRRFKELKREGLTHPAGQAAFDRRNKSERHQYSYEQKQSKLTPAYSNKLQSNEKAWSFFSTLSPNIQKKTVHWVMSAKHEDTRLRRLNILIESSSKSGKIPPLTYI